MTVYVDTARIPYGHMKLILLLALLLLSACSQPRTVCTSRQVVDVPEGGSVAQEKTVTVCEREITGGRGG